MAEAGNGVESAGRVLVADDEPANRLLLRELLEAHSYQVVEAVDGLEALQHATAQPPDLVLLDVMMPNLDGYEVCRQLKATPQTRPIPVLLVTSLHAREERLQGIRAGANDFLTKPLDTADLVLRVRNAVNGKRLYDRLAEQYFRLQELEALRDSLVHMVVHDLRSPFGALAAFVELIETDPLGALSRDQRSSLEECRLLVAQITSMINSVLDVNRLEAGKMPLLRAPHRVADLVEEAVRTLGPTAAVRVAVSPEAIPAQAYCDRGLITRVLVNLISNALKFSAAHLPVQVEVGRSPKGGTRVQVRDQGPGIPADRVPLIFEKFGQLETTSQRGHHAVGLGLTFCRMAVEAHGGLVGVVSAPDEGSTFWFDLPDAPAERLGG
jgi:two-component system sensor histidine kinase/response regulator